jgi:hypothetical protein
MLPRGLYDPPLYRRVVRPPKTSLHSRRIAAGHRLRIAYAACFKMGQKIGKGLEAEGASCRRAWASHECGGPVAGVVQCQDSRHVGRGSIGPSVAAESFFLMPRKLRAASAIWRATRAQAPACRPQAIQRTLLARNHQNPQVRPFSDCVPTSHTATTISPFVPENFTKGIEIGSN